MPRYYFHIRDAEGMSRDEEGTELPNLDSARREARASARDLIVDSMKSRKIVEGQTLEIMDSLGRLIETMSVKDALI
jgi:hypothetical protein